MNKINEWKISEQPLAYDPSGNTLYELFLANIEIAENRKKKSSQIQEFSEKICLLFRRIKNISINT